MGKKIPKSRRHKKLKFVDPCYSGTIHDTKKKKLLPNEPPTEEDFQEVPRNVSEFINLKNQAKANKLKRKKKKKKIMKDEFIVVKTDKNEGDTWGSTKRIKELPEVIKQKPYESEQRFFNRLQNMADSAIAEAKIEAKYNIELVNVSRTGNAQYISGPKENGAKKREKRKKLKEKVIEKKKLKLEESKFDFQKEKIQFGEVALAPPVFSAKPRKAPQTDKAGKKELHLKTILKTKSNEETDLKPVSIKWKTMPSEKRKIIENERSRAVQMYRILKNKKKNS